MFIIIENSRSLFKPWKYYDRGNQILIFTLYVTYELLDNGFLCIYVMSKSMEIHRMHKICKHI